MASRHQVRESTTRVGGLGHRAKCKTVCYLQLHQRAMLGDHTWPPFRLASCCCCPTSSAAPRAHLQLDARERLPPVRALGVSGPPSCLQGKKERAHQIGLRRE